MILALDAALAGCSAGVVAHSGVVAMRRAEGARGQVAGLAAMAQSVLRDAGIAAPSLMHVAVTIGPGSFTGIRAALSLAHGIALASGIPAVGVTVGEALWHPSDGRAHWAAVDSRRGLVFLDRDGVVASVALDRLPDPIGPVSVCGDAAGAVVAQLLARGHDAVLWGAATPDPAGIAAASLRRIRSGPDPRPVQPLYVDPPAARLPGAC